MEATIIIIIRNYKKKQSNDRNDANTFESRAKLDMSEDTAPVPVDKKNSTKKMSIPLMVATICTFHIITCEYAGTFSVSFSSIYIISSSTESDTLPSSVTTTFSTAVGLSSTSAAAVASECDIGKLLHSNVNICDLSRPERHKILTTEPNPDPSYYPRTRQFRQFLPAWLKQYPWLHYSREMDGAFSRDCTYFAPKRVGG